MTSWLLLASFSAAAAQPSPPPWSVEAPGAAGATFGLGLDGLFERQESLDIESSESTITVQGSEETIPGDPDLLNRKFDMRWDLEGIGAQLPIALPSVGRRLYPTLILQAASVDVALDFLDRSRESDSTSLDGQGEIFGGGLDLVAPLGRRGYAAGSYRFQKLPHLTVDRSSSFESPGAEVVHDEVQLSREAQDLSLRIGYSFPGGRFASYLGARRRWTEMDVEDELRFVNANRQETSLTSRTELESEEVFGFAGLDIHVWGPLYARAETTFGGDDRSTLLKAVYLWPRGRGAGGGPASGPSSGEPGAGPGTEPVSGEGTPGTEGRDEEGLVQVGPKTPAEEDELDRRASQIAAAIAPLLAAIETDFLAGWKGLSVVDGPQGPSYRARDVDALLANTERRLVSVLGEYPELEAFKDGVQDEFRAVRKELGFDAGDSRGEGTQDRNTLAFAAFYPQRHRFQLVQERLLEKQRTDQILNRTAQRPVGTPKQATQEDRLRRTITFRTTLPRGTTLLIHPRYNRTSPHAARLAPNAPQKVWLGTVSFEVWPRGQRGRPQCDARTAGPDAMCPLDLLYNVCSVVRCDQLECTLQGCRP